MVGNPGDFSPKNKKGICDRIFSQNSKILWPQKITSQECLIYIFLVDFGIVATNQIKFIVNSTNGIFGENIIWKVTRIWRGKNLKVRIQHFFRE
jgi:hypothetical protein